MSRPQRRPKKRNRILPPPPTVGSLRRWLIHVWPFTNRAREREALIRAYAKGDVSWYELQRRGFDSYYDVLAALGECGSRPPIAAMVGPNVESRQRAIAGLTEHLRHMAPSSGQTPPAPEP